MSNIYMYSLDNPQFEFMLHYSFVIQRIPIIWFFEFQTNFKPASYQGHMPVFQHTVGPANCLIVITVYVFIP